MTMISNTAAPTTLSRRRWPGNGFANARALLILMWEAFAEGQAMARAAHKRYPFAEW